MGWIISIFRIKIKFISKHNNFQFYWTNWIAATAATDSNYLPTSPNSSYFYILILLSLFDQSIAQIRVQTFAFEFLLQKYYNYRVVHTARKRNLLYKYLKTFQHQTQIKFENASVYGRISKCNIKRRIFAFTNYKQKYNYNNYRSTIF